VRLLQASETTALPRVRLSSAGRGLLIFGEMDWRTTRAELQPGGSWLTPPADYAACRVDHRGGATGVTAPAWALARWQQNSAGLAQAARSCCHLPRATCTAVANPTWRGEVSDLAADRNSWRWSCVCASWRRPGRRRCVLDIEEPELGLGRIEDCARWSRTCASATRARASHPTRYPRLPGQRL